MDIFQAIRDRRSIRRYQDLPVEPEKIDQILEAARLAPSWKNLQCWRFIVVSDTSVRQRLLKAFHADNPGTKAIAGAPITIVVCADPRESGVENDISYYIADTAIAFEHLCLAAHALGLGTCWMGWFEEAAIKTVLGIPEPFKVVGVTPLGYPDQAPKPRPRKNLDEIVHHNRWEAP
ncbi:MAG: nitroreductase [Desulfuromonas sp.]|nr:MAG: nitroreductase [Desulfuromonas sp.]